MFTNQLIVHDVHLGPQTIDLKPYGDLICDIDGTIADLTHRRKYVTTNPKNWEAFERSMHLDTPIETICDAVRTLSSASWQVVYCSGRGQQNFMTTRNWIEDNKLPVGRIYMRAEGDYRDDGIVKSELLDRILKRYHPTLVFDDRDRVVKMWRDRGLRCIQVAEGNF